MRRKKIASQDEEVVLSLRIEIKNFARMVSKSTKVKTHIQSQDEDVICALELQREKFI